MFLVYTFEYIKFVNDSLEQIKEEYQYINEDNILYIQKKASEFVENNLEPRLVDLVPELERAYRNY